jgi:hypothetical protein
LGAAKPTVTTDGLGSGPVFSVGMQLGEPRRNTHTLMSRLRVPLVLFALAISCETSFATSRKQVTTSRQACAVLKRGAITYHLSRRNLSGRYYCDSIGDNSEYFLVGLRYRVTADEMVGSNLLGWFAVRRADSVILEWDINEDKAFPLRPRPPFEQ